MATNNPTKYKTIEEGYIIPSGLYSVPKSSFRYIGPYEEKPQVGDVVYCRVSKISQHNRLENKQGRIHNLYEGSEFIGVFGNRYAPDQFEAVVPKRKLVNVELFSWGGLVGEVLHKNDAMRDPTLVEILGYVYDKDKKQVNTLKHQIVRTRTDKVKKPRAKMILVVGTAMNSGKSTAASAIIWAIKHAGHRVRASKVTGTASLKDVLHMNDAGAKYFSDFTFLGHPSTYLLKESELTKIFNSLDLRYANNPENYWVVEFADGISQRETAMLLRHPMVRDRIDKLIFCAADTFGAIGGVEMLRDDFKLEPDVISGVCTSSPMFMEEIKNYLNVPVMNNTAINSKEILKMLGVKRKRKK